MRRVCAAQCEAPKRERSPKHADPARMSVAKRCAGTRHKYCQSEYISMHKNLTQGYVFAVYKLG
ncbi:MAG: hypothetical protein NZ455_02450 [Bacteroidia bacterium]|nr:hypothetical protein [Bacteroidia bacterium]